MSTCPAHIKEAFVISEAMIRLADRREEVCSHDGCLLLDSVIRDCAYKIRAAAERYRRELETEEQAADDSNAPSSANDANREGLSIGTGNIQSG